MLATFTLRQRVENRTILEPVAIFAAGGGLQCAPCR
jgi:hypothetical protein